MKFGVFSVSSFCRRLGRLVPEMVRARRLGWDWSIVREVALLSHEHLYFFIAARVGLCKVAEKDGCWSISFFRQRLFFDVPEGGSALRVARNVLRMWRDVYRLDQYRAGEVLRSGMVALDIGASVGAFSLLASRLVGPRGQVVAFEPVEANWKCLEKNLAASSVRNVVVCRYALGASDGELAIRLSPHNPGGHSAVRCEPGGTVVVPMRSVDSIVAEMKLERVDFIKADVEGMEPDVIRGAAATIRRFKPCLAISAYHLPEHRRLLPQLVREIDPQYDCSVAKAFPGAELILTARVRRAQNHAKS